jgi:hypothetical protein
MSGANDPTVVQWSEITTGLVEKAIQYGIHGQYDEHTDEAIRAVRARCQVLLAALQQAQVPRPANMMPPH